MFFPAALCVQTFSLGRSRGVLPMTGPNFRSGLKKKIQPTLTSKLKAYYHLVYFYSTWFYNISPLLHSWRRHDMEIQTLKCASYSYPSVSSSAFFACMQSFYYILVLMVPSQRGGCSAAVPEGEVWGQTHRSGGFLLGGVLHSSPRTAVPRAQSWSVRLR